MITIMITFKGGVLSLIQFAWGKILERGTVLSAHVNSGWVLSVRLQYFHNELNEALLIDFKV